MDGDTNQAGAAEPTGSPVGVGPEPERASPPRTRRGKLILFLAFAILLTVALAFLRKSVEVDVTVKATQVSFKVDDERVSRLFNSVGADSLIVSTFEKITLARGTLEVTGEVDSGGRPVNWRRPPRPPDAENVIVPGEPTAYVTFNEVTLNSLKVPVGAKAIISWTAKEPGAVNFNFDKSASGEAVGRSVLTFSCNECRLSGLPDDGKAPPIYFRLTVGRDGANIVRFDGSPDSTVVALNLPTETNLKEQNIPMPGGVNFIANGGDGHPVSTITGGDIEFEQEVKKPIKLAEGSMVAFDMKDAAVRTVTVGQGITIDLHGRASKLSVGASEKDMEDQLPSVLQWLIANPLLGAIYLALVTVVGLILKFTKWWSGSGEQS